MPKQNKSPPKAPLHSDLSPVSDSPPPGLALQLLDEGGFQYVYRGGPKADRPLSRYMLTKLGLNF
jgi:hypothetical protein